MSETQSVGESIIKKTEENKQVETVSTKSLYELLKVEEAKPADPNEMIPVGKISEEDPEYQKLIQAGVSIEEFETKKIPRRKLLEAGFVFNNQPLFAIEKPLINIEIDGVDYGKRKLLTGEELEKLKQYQRAHPDLYGFDGVSSDEFREEMYRFLLTAEQPLPPHVEDKVNFYRMNALDEIKQPDFAELVRLHRQNLIKSDANPVPAETKFVEDKLGDILPWDEERSPDRFRIRAREHKMLAIESRKGKLNGTPSPFLDSGFHFSNNPDYVVVGSDGRLFRVNMMVLHLTSRGISEMGEGKDAAGEQDYSVGNYIRELTPKDETGREKIKEQEEKKLQLKLNFNEEELMQKVQERLKNLAVEWAMSENAPPEAKKLAQKIKLAEQNQGKSFFSRIAGRFRN